MSLLARDTAPTCYSLSGVRAPFPNDLLTYTPCNHTAVAHNQHSACCASTDLCLSNGLCKYNNPDPTVTPFNEYWRIGCTDPTYKDPACPKQCADVGGGNPGETRLVFQCPGTGKWCCGTGALEDYKSRGTVNTTCCDEVGLAFREDSQAFVYTTAATMTPTASKSSTKSARETTSSSSPEPSSVVFEAATTTTAPEFTSTPSPESSPSSLSSSSPSSYKPLAYGLGFGLGIPLLTCLLIALYLLLTRRRTRRQKALSTAPAPDPSEQYFRSDQHTYYHLAEAGSREMPAEVDAKKEPVEAWTPGLHGNEWMAELKGDTGTVGAREVDAGRDGKW